MPITSAGMRSGVNWMRLTVQSSERPIAFASVVLPKPGTSSSRMCPSHSNATSTSSTTVSLPTITRRTFSITAVASREMRSMAISVVSISLASRTPHLVTGPRCHTARDAPSIAVADHCAALCTIQGRPADRAGGGAMKAEIVSIGTEILLGEILDTNAQYIAARLPALGIDLYFMHQVGDNRARLTGVLRQAWERSDVVFCTGGLGPTEDDVTREAVCDLIGEQPHVDPDQEQILRRFFEGRGYPMPERNLKQAWLTPSATAIPNPRGTEPGWWVAKDGKLLIVMPGPPTEMARMWEKEVEPRLRGRSTEAVIISRTIKTGGIGEGSVDEMITPLLHSDNPTIGVYAKLD